MSDRHDTASGSLSRPANHRRRTLRQRHHRRSHRHRRGGGDVHKHRPKSHRRTQARRGRRPRNGKSSARATHFCLRRHRHVTSPWRCIVRIDRRCRHQARAASGFRGRRQQNRQRRNHHGLLQSADRDRPDQSRKTQAFGGDVVCILAASARRAGARAAADPIVKANSTKQASIPSIKCSLRNLPA